MRYLLPLSFLSCPLGTPTCSHHRIAICCLCCEHYSLLVHGNINAALSLKLQDFCVYEQSGMIVK